MDNIHQQLLTRPTYVEIDCDAIRDNFSIVKKMIGHAELMAIVKGNAYGHGSVEVATLFQDLGVNYLGVAIPEEGVELRQAGITVPILVLSAIVDQQIPVCIQYDLTITAPSDEKILLINKLALEAKKIAKVHVKIDTGMGRIGVHWERVSKFFDAIRQSASIDFEGIYSHLARSDEDSDFNQTQIDRFNHALANFNEAGFKFNKVHLANSGGTIFHANAHFTMVRAGMMLYGLFEGIDVPSELVLKPVMSWKTQVVYFKYIEQGVGIGYGHHYIASKATRIVTLPVGYADGYQRAMGPKGKVILRDTLYPIAGRICMDQMMIDIGRNGESYKGDEVILVGSSPSCTITFFDVSKWSGTSIYELLSQISYRVPRVYKNR